MPRTNQEEAVLNAVSGQTVDAALGLGPIYEDASYRYFGEAVPGTALTASDWRVSRQAKADGQVQWADGTGERNNVFTDLTTVAAMVFA